MEKILNGQHNQSINKILVIKLGGVGDVLLVIPLLNVLQRSISNARISLLVKPVGSAQVIEGSDIVDEIIYLPEDIHKNPLLLSNFVSFLRNKKYDMVFNTFFGRAFYSEVFVWLLNSRYRIGFATKKNGDGFLYTHRVSVNPPRHSVDYDLDLARALGIRLEPNDRIPSFRNISKEDETRVYRLLKDTGISRGSFIAIHPGSSRRSRLWRAERFAKVADALSAEYSFSSVFVGGQADLPIIASITQLMHTKPLVLAGRLSFSETAAVFQMCRLALCIDSGPMHLAAAVGAPLVALFGPGDIINYSPIANGSPCRILYHQLPCGPCYKEFCVDTLCMNKISTEEVLIEVREILS